MKTTVIFYLILFSGLTLGFVGFFALSGLPTWRLANTVALALFYFCWGMVYHYKEKTLHFKVVFEYLLISLLGLAFLLVMIW